MGKQRKKRNQPATTLVSYYYTTYNNIAQQTLYFLNELFQRVTYVVGTT